VPDSTAPAAEEPLRPRRVGLLLGVAAFVLAADIISKAIVVARMPDHAPIRLLDGLLTITLTRNGGAAFSIGTSMTVVFTAIAVGVIVYILRAARNLRSIGWAVTLGLLLGGATGNLVDRIFRAPGLFEGHVVDWIELPHWPVFNLADSSIVCAGVLVVLLALRGIRLDGTRPIPEASSPQLPEASSSQLPDTSSSQLPDTSSSQLPETSSSKLPQPSSPQLPQASFPQLPEASSPLPRAGTSEPNYPESEYPESEYPEPQSAAPADFPGRVADDGR
jgi:signal peptidase II